MVLSIERLDAYVFVNLDSKKLRTLGNRNTSQIPSGDLVDYPMGEGLTKGAIIRPIFFRTQIDYQVKIKHFCVWGLEPWSPHSMNVGATEGTGDMSLPLNVDKEEKVSFLLSEIAPLAS